VSTGSTSFVGSSEICSPSGRILTAGNNANTVTANIMTTKTATTNSGGAGYQRGHRERVIDHESRRAAAHIPSSTPRIVEMMAERTISTAGLPVSVRPRPIPARSG
jgi:hypothetical protein